MKKQHLLLYKTFQLAFIVLMLFANSPVMQAQEVALSSKEAKLLKSKVIKTASNIQSITSDFVQKKHLDFLTNDIETFGKMVFKAPNLIRWEYIKPFEYSVIFRNDKLFINDGGTKSNVNLKSYKMFQSLNELIAKSIKGDMFDEAAFTISYFSNNGNYLVKFKPKRKELNEYITTFELTFDSNDANVLEVKMVEPTADYTRIIFKNRLLNEVVTDEVFKN